jgi:tRNA-specific 2-thiouridylase
MTSKGRVAVAMSGGVDSSVAAALLQQEGYEVTGVFIVTWSAPWLPCTWREERQDALRVATSLGLPFETIDASDVYEQEVVEYMVREYAEGMTPNPDVMCNKSVKFGVFYTWAREHGYDYVATGHYAQNGHNQELMRAVDASKDQSYFLWAVPKDVLARTLFPIGTYYKDQVRELASQIGLHTATKKDSQGICFLGQVDIKEFLTHYIDAERGNLLNTKGDVIGYHDGALFYTLGERHGFTVTRKTPNDAPQYVVAKDVRANTVTVAERATTTADVTELTLKDINLLTDKLPRKAEAQYRYHGVRVPVSIETAGSDLVVRFETPEQYVAVGQSLVLYEGNTCLGGGSIQKTA